MIIHNSVPHARCVVAVLLYWRRGGRLFYFLAFLTFLKNAISIFKHLSVCLLNHHFLITDNLENTLFNFFVHLLFYSTISAFPSTLPTHLKSLYSVGKISSYSGLTDISLSFPSFFMYPLPSTINMPISPTSISV